jgi:hypothetical protein
VTLTEYRAVRLVDRRWQLLKGREAVLVARMLRRSERKRRHARARGERGGGRRLDPHGNHRHIVKITTLVELREMVHEAFWDTI